MQSAGKAVVVGAGVGGLAAALRLQSAGYCVTLLDSHSWPGGKMRQVQSVAGPIDAGPTVLTMRRVFDDLFEATGTRLAEHVTLVREPLLARHFWVDGSILDLKDDHDANVEAITAFSGRTAAQDYKRFANDAATLFEAFRAPMMESAEPKLTKLAAAALSNPRLLQTLSPFANMRKALTQHFSDPRLVQLFGRYATYVGGSPLASPAILQLIWQAEASGVWRVAGGIHELALALATRFEALGGTLRLGTPVASIETSGSRITGVRLKAGDALSSDIVIFAGDPRALATGQLGAGVSTVAPQTLSTGRSLSARVWSFAARAITSQPLAHHNVFFGKDPTAEFEDLAGGAIPRDPTIYLCAEDRGSGMALPTAAERIEIILNATPLTDAIARPDEEAQCRQTTFQTLARFGLTFDPLPDYTALATPTTFDTLFPASAGSLYGQSPHGMTAALRRPRARTRISGLYLAGGGTHPGAGVPMAALSGKHAVEAIMQDHVSTSR